MLVLFDIDMTLLQTHHVGMRFLEDAGSEAHGEGFSAASVEFGGCLDPDIIARLLESNGVDATPERIGHMRERYHASMDENKHNAGWSEALDGAHDLVQGVRTMDPRPICGLLTGTYPETGKLKLEGAGFDPDHFELCVWGDDAPEHPPTRDQLPRVAFELATKQGVEIHDPSHVIIIGDTVHDVRCALVNDCSVIAVATGHHSAEALRDAGAHLVLDNLNDTQGVIGWIHDRLNQSPSQSGPSRSTR